MNTPSSSFANLRQSGFTLVEVLVSVSLLSIIMVALGTALRTMAQTESRVDQRLQQIDDLRVARGLLQQVLGRVATRKLRSVAEAGRAEVAFRATSQSIEWIGIMPARNGSGGRYFFRLQPEEVQDGSELVLRFAPWDANAVGFPDWTTAQARTLSKRLAKFEVTAQASLAQLKAPDSRPINPWTQGWASTDHIPVRVQIKWASVEAQWPDLVIPIVGMSQGKGGLGSFVIGGTQ